MLKKEKTRITELRLWDHLVQFLSTYYFFPYWNTVSVTFDLKPLKHNHYLLVQVITDQKLKKFPHAVKERIILVPGKGRPCQWGHCGTPEVSWHAAVQWITPWCGPPGDQMLPEGEGRKRKERQSNLEEGQWSDPVSCVMLVPVQ